MCLQKTQEEGRFRNFATIIYEDSASEDWIEKLCDMHIPLFISPYHDSDMDESGSGELKKAHWHLLLMFEGKKSVKQVQNLLSEITSVKVQIIESKRGYARYLCHLDNADKYQYSCNMVIQMAGADYMDIINSVSDKYLAIRMMILYCKNENITSYSDLVEYAMDNEFDWFRILCDNGTVIMKEYLKSKNWTTEKLKNKIT